MSGYNEILEMGTPRSPASVSAKSMPLPELQTLRDRFAMTALNATLMLWEPHRNDPKTMAERAYEIADAMMEARK